jgi:hypothetical protein
MSAADRPLAEMVTEVVALLEGHDDAEYEALAPQAKANYQEALEFLSRLESSLGDDVPERTDDRETPVSVDYELASTMGSDEALRGPFGSKDVVVYDPAESDIDRCWISMAHDATIPFENTR